MITKRKIKKELTLFNPMILSRHPSHRVFRKTLGLFRGRSVIRLGSETQLNDGRRRVEINTVESVRNSASKLRMKQCFTGANVKTANWYIQSSIENGKQMFQGSGLKAYKEISVNEFLYPIIAKSFYGSRGRGNTKLDNPQELKNWMKGKDLSQYVFEEFFDGAREYRFHVSTLGVFLTWRKLRRNDTPEDQRWFFNNENCNWVSEQHQLYNKPSTYNEICSECLKALNAVGLSIGACDVRVDKKGNFIIIEINSAPSMAEVTATAYKAEFKKLITNKLNN